MIIPPELHQFPAVWAVCFKYDQQPGEWPLPKEMAAYDLFSKTCLHLDQGQLARCRGSSPFTPNDLVLVWPEPGELGCFIAQGWPLPKFVIDIYAETCVAANGVYHPREISLPRAMELAGLIPSRENDPLLGKAMDISMLLFCRGLFGPLLSQALMRGSFVAAAAQIEWSGIPIDTVTHRQLVKKWLPIKWAMAKEASKQFDVFEHSQISEKKLAAFLTARGIEWPRDSGNRLLTDAETWRDMARSYPMLNPLAQVARTLGNNQPQLLSIGSDHRNRSPLKPFASKTGRNQPSSAEWVFGLPAWQRGVIFPEPSMGLAYVDFVAEEFGIGAALSGDRAQQADYRSPDAYLAFGKRAELAPPEATKTSHADLRSQLKEACLGISYGMGARSLGIRIGQTEERAADIIQRHQESYHVFWEWMESVLDCAAWYGRLWTPHGWCMTITPDMTVPQLRNWTLQSTGADVIRLACVLAIQRGIRVLAPVHDALLVEGPADSIEDVAAATQTAMEEASEVVLNGFRLRTSVDQIIRHPDRFADKRGTKIWEMTQNILSQPIATAIPRLMPRVS